MPRERDPIWQYVTSVNNKKWRCHFCKQEIHGSATRIKAHLAGIPGYGIKGCEGVNVDVKERARMAMGRKVMDSSDQGVVEEMIQDNVRAALTGAFHVPLPSQNHQLLDNTFQIPKDIINTPGPSTQEGMLKDTLAGASSSQYDRSTVLHSNEPLPSCNEVSGTETSAVPLRVLRGIYPLTAVQATTGPLLSEATHVNSQVLDGRENMTGSSSSQELDVNKGAPMMSHPNTGDNFEGNGALKRKRDHSSEDDINEELKYAPSLSLKKREFEDNSRNDFHSVGTVSENCVQPHQQLDIVMQVAEDLEMQEGLFVARKIKINKLLEGKMVGEAFQKNTRRILEYLVGNQISRLGIYGMGGVGKTTLMVHIHNSLLEKANYDNVLWITVSQDFNTQMLQHDIWKALDLGILQERDVRKRAAMLSDALTKREKLIIILDDVWEGFDLEEVGIPVRVDGLKLVLTTRSFDVCCQMGCQEKIKIEPLSLKEAEGLFLEGLGSKVALDRETKAIMMSIIEECAGLPLAIITMARSMRGVTDVFEWKDCLEKLREPYMCQTVMEKVMMKLEHTYNRLGCEVQQCFLSCAFYPEDKLIEKFELIEFFIDQGLIGGLNTREIQYNRGLTILNKLANVCLLEDHGTKVKMHDLIRDMALHIMSGTAIIKAGKGLKWILPEEYWMDTLEKVSLMENDIRKFPLNMSPNCPKLSTFLLNRSLRGGVVIPDSFFKNLPGLKVLNLSGCELIELPDSISDLVNLRALLLGQCSNLQRIPCLKKLTSLRKLDAGDCEKLQALEGLENLANLRYLDLTKTCIEISPKGTLDCLPYLQCLKVSAVTNLSGMNSLEYLEELEIRECESLGVLFEGHNEVIDIHDFLTPTLIALSFGSLRSLQIKKCPKLKYLFGHGSKSNLLHLRKIGISECEEMVGITAAITSPPSHLLPFFPSLEEISVDRCDKMKRAVESEWMCYFPNLRRVEVSECERMEEIIGGPPSNLPMKEISLEALRVCGCNNMRKLFLHDWLLHLRNLRSIYVYGCGGMVEMISGARQGQEGSIMTSVNNTPSSFQPSSISLPKLERLELRHLPRLKSICKVPISCDSMKNLSVYGCPELKGIPLQLRLCEIEELPYIWVEDEEMWKTLMWDHPDSQAILRPFLRKRGCHCPYGDGRQPPCAIELDVILPRLCS